MRNLKKILLNITLVVAVLLVPVIVFGATTVGNNVSVGGTLGVTGLFTPTGGISTSTLDAVVIGGSTVAAGSFAALSATGAAVLNGAVTLGDAATDSITATGYFLTSLSVGNGTTATSTLASNSLAVAKAANFNVGKFYVDSSGNVTASGTLGVTGLLTPTGGISTSTLDGVVIGGSTVAAGSFAALSATGAAVLNGAVTLGDAATDSITATGYFLTSLSVGNGTTATSTLASNSLAVAKAANFNVGKFYVDSSGNVTASGTLGVTGLLTPTGGISTSTLDGVVIGGSTVAAGSFAALSATGAAVLNGTVALGNETGDDITVTGYIASHIIAKTNNTYNIGSFGKAFANVYASSSVFMASSTITNMSTSTLYLHSLGGNTGGQIVLKAYNGTCYAVYIGLFNDGALGVTSTALATCY